MRIGLVADNFEIRSGTGIARYAAKLLTGLVEKGWDAVPISVLRFRGPGGVILVHTVQLPCQVLRLGRRTDLVHATSPITAIPFPFLRQEKVVTFHDLISLLYRGSGTTIHARAALPTIFRTVAHASDRIIAVSSQTKEEIITHLGADPNRITVIPLGVSDEFRPAPQAVHKFPVVGYLGHMKSRKRLDLLIRAFQLLVRRCPEINAHLAIHGTRDSEFPRLHGMASELGIQDRTTFPGFANDTSLPDIYQSFDCFVMPSDWEGFGLPILEAQRCGVPVIIRNEARIPEEVSRCCVKAISLEDMAEQMARLLLDAEFSQKIASNALAYSSQFTWERTVTETIAVYDSILK
jgi:glycosyltransferase involved in cell wall biosynthesis